MSEFKQQLWSINMIPNDILFEKNKRLEQALEEIKEIAEFSYRPYRVCGEYNDGCDVLNEIIQKVSEVIDD